MEKRFYNVRDFGATGDGTTLDTAKIQAALDACKDCGGRVILPSGDYRISSVRIYSNTEVYLEPNARIIADIEEANYEALRGKYDCHYPRDAKTLIGRECNDASNALHALILSTKRGATDSIFFAEGAENIRITGGEIFGNAESFFTPGEDGKRFVPKLFRPQLIVLKKCRNVQITDLKLLDAPYFNIRAIECEAVQFDKLTIQTDLRYINTDGINVSACKEVSISNCRFQTGDDCIAISNGEFTPLLQDCEDITVSNCIGRTKANLVRVFNGIEADLSVDAGLGTELQLTTARAHAVRNIRISNCTLEEGACAINMIGVLGLIENVEFSHITARHAKTAVFMVIQKEGKIRDVTIRDTSCHADGLATIQGTTKDSISGVRIENCDFLIAPRARLFGNGLIDPLIHYWLAASAPYNLYIRHATDVSVSNTCVRWEPGGLCGIEKFASPENRPKEYEHLWREDMMPSDKFPCVDATDVCGLKLCKLDATGYQSEQTVRTRTVEDFTIE